MNAKVKQLCDYIVKTKDPEKLRWGWGEGLLMFALLKWDLANSTTDHIPFVKKYYERFLKKPPVIDCSDRVAPALALAYYERITGKTEFDELINSALNYYYDSKKIVGTIPNHFGTSADATYPQSIWIDSIMMLSVFLAEAGMLKKDTALCDTAWEQAFTFADKLSDRSGLWYHSYHTEKKNHYPKSKLFWGRGNGWVLVAFPMLLERMMTGRDISKFAAIYEKTAEAVIKRQCRDGSFRTLLNRRESYKETSATALAAAGLYAAMDIGLVGEGYRTYADRAYAYCLRKLETNPQGTFLNGISRPTVPMLRIPYLWYMIMPRRANFSYGVAAMILADVYRDNK